MNEPNQQVKGHWTKARARLFEIIEELVKWENTTNETFLEKARDAIRQSWRETCELNKEHPLAKELFDADSRFRIGLLSDTGSNRVVNQNFSVYQRVREFRQFWYRTALARVAVGDLESAL